MNDRAQQMFAEADAIERAARENQSAEIARARELRNRAGALQAPLGQKVDRFHWLMRAVAAVSRELEANLRFIAERESKLESFLAPDTSECGMGRTYVIFQNRPEFVTAPLVVDECNRRLLAWRDELVRLEAEIHDYCHVNEIADPLAPAPQPEPPKPVAAEPVPVRGTVATY